MPGRARLSEPRRSGRACPGEARRSPGAASALTKSLAAAALALVPVLAVVACGSCAQPPKSARPPNVIVILLDACRADHLGCYGAARATSPNLDALAAESVLFERATSVASWTKSSVPSIFTGLYPIEHRVFTGNRLDTADRITSDVLSASHVTLAEAFKASGFDTAAFIRNAQISSFLGFAQGFDLYAEDVGNADKITSGVLEWLDERGSRPFFVYLHYIDPHWPYKPPADVAALFPLPAGASIDPAKVDWKEMRRRIEDGDQNLAEPDREALRVLYDGDIRYTDRAVGRLLDGLRERGIYEDTVVVVTADHGEEFFEHGGIGHGTSLYEELLHVPLIIKAPGTAPRRVRDLVQSIDIYPTVLDLAKGKPAEAISGRSLGPLMRGESGAPRPVFAHLARGNKDDRILQSVHAGKHKLIRTFIAGANVTGAGRQDPQRGGARQAVLPGLERPLAKVELYDLEADPGETHELSAQQPEIVRDLGALLDAWEKDHDRGDRNDNSIPLDEQTIEKLRSLGYVR